MSGEHRFSDLLLKRVAEAVLSATVASGPAIRRMRGRCLVLAYHNVLPPGATAVGDRSLHLPWSQFMAQMDLLARHVHVVPLARLLASGNADDERPQVVITFDDAYVGAVHHALPELVRRGMPATVFVAPALLDGEAFWWDRLADASTGAVREEQREYALQPLAGRDAMVMAWAAQQGLSVSDPAAHSRGAPVEALDHAATLPGMTFGAHTWSHPNVAQLSGAELEQELARPLAWIERFGNRALQALAYPYGLFGDKAEQVARGLGYRLTFRVDGGWMERGAQVAEPLPRWNVSAGVSADGFRLRLAGVLAR